MIARRFVLALLVALPAAVPAQPVQPGVPLETLDETVEADVVAALQARELVTSDDVPSETAVRAALIDFQAASGLAPTGWVDRETLDALGLADVNPGPTPTDVPGEASFHRHEAERLARAAEDLRRQAEFAGTSPARDRLLAGARRSAEVARIHRASAGDEALPSVPPGPVGAAEPPPAVLEDELTRDEVTAVQLALAARGLFAPPPTGVLDSPTVEALAAWQRLQGREATGALDVQTFGELVRIDAAGAPQPVPTPALP